MNRTNLIQHLIARFPQYSPKDVELAVRLVLEGLSGSSSHGRRVEIRSFGSFDLNYPFTRRVRNSMTGKKIQVPAKYISYYRPGNELRARILAQVDSLLSKSKGRLSN